MVCKGRGRRATSVCANLRLWSDEGVAEAFRRNNAIIVLHKLQLFLFNGASRANCRGRRPRRPALAEGTLAEGNMSPMLRFLRGDSNLCRGELRSSVWFAHNHGCGSMWASTSTNVTRRKFARDCGRIWNPPLRLTENCRGEHCKNLHTYPLVFSNIYYCAYWRLWGIIKA